MNRRTVQSYAVFWLAGVAFLWWPVTLLRIAADKRPPGRRPVALLITCTCLTASLLLAVIGGAEPSRLVAACANLSVWLTLCFLLARRWGRRDADEVMRGLVDLATFQGVLAVIGVTVYPALSGITLPLARLLPDSLAAEPNVAAFSTLQLGQQGYYGGFVVRTGGIFGTATWAGALAALAVLALVFSHRSLGPRMQHPALRTGAVALCILTLYWSYARVDTLALVVAAAAVMALRLRRVVHPSAWLGALLLAAAVVIGLLPTVPLERWLGDANRPREDSLVTRVEIYESTLARVAHAPTPLVGAGIKQRAEGLVASEGTHSTYLGLTYRGGVICAVSFVIFLIGLAYRASSDDDGVAFGITCFLLVWCVTDDIDPGNLVPLGILIAWGMTADSSRESAAPSAETSAVLSPNPPIGLGRPTRRPRSRSPWTLRANGWSNASMGR